MRLGPRVNKIEREQLKAALVGRVEEFHLVGQHDQLDHGVRGVHKTIQAVRDETGVTLEPRTGRKITTGIMVGLRPEQPNPVTVEDFLSGSKGKEKGRQQYRDWLKRELKAGTFDKPEIKAGVWVDNGRVYIEPSERFSNAEIKKAETANNTRGQISSWDLTNDKELFRKT